MQDIFEQVGVAAYAFSLVGASIIVFAVVAFFQSQRSRRYYRR